MRHVLCLTAFAALAFGQQTLTCSFQFTGSGTIGMSKFTNAGITITTVGNTANSLATDGGAFIRNDSTSVFISGLGAFQFLVPSEISNIVTNPALPGTTISLTDNDGNAFIWAFYTDSSWGMSTTVGPLTLGGNLSPLVMPEALTNGGAFTLNVADLTVTFRAVVATPEQPYIAISAVTNAAIPGLDIPFSSPPFPTYPTSVHLAPRSMATIYGTNLAGTTASSISPWSPSLGGTEVHLVSDSCADPTCDLVASLIYVSPTQINFLVPDDGEKSYAVPIGYRIVFLQSGQRIDNHYSQGYPGYPGYLYIDSFYIGDYSVVFQVGYDCLFSYSLSDPGACGLSWSQGTGRAPLGAITDAITGQLISSGNPVHQGQLLTLWTTGFQGGATSSTNGLLTAQIFPAIGFGVAALGKDLASGFMSPAPLWAGESPEYIGLDQVNIAFPICASASSATAEQRYDAFLTLAGGLKLSSARIYVPFDVSPGDPDCADLISSSNPNRTATAVEGSMSPASYLSGQSVTLTAAMSPSPGPTGVVVFVDTTNYLLPVVLGSASVNTADQASLAATFVCNSGMSCGRTITITYQGDTNYAGSTGQITVSGQAAGSNP